VIKQVRVGAIASGLLGIRNGQDAHAQCVLPPYLTWKP
jgi:hypothetical protein